MTNRRLLRLIGQAVRQADFRRLDPRGWDYQELIWPVKALLHPVAAFQTIKYEKRGSLALANLILALFFVARVFAFIDRGFLFNYNEFSDLNLRMQFMTSVMPVIFWCVANWSICTLMSGEGRFREIWICTAYSMLPVVLSLFIGTIASNFMTVTEGAFLTVLEGGAWLMTLLMLFISNMIIHQYSFRKTVLSLALTFLGILAMMFLVVLVASLFQQLFTFIQTLGREIVLRVRKGW